VAVDAKLHLKVDGDQSVLPFHLSMARGAIDPVSDVGLMVEFNMIRDVKHSDPWDRGLRIEMPPLLDDLGMLGNDIPVTEEALSHRWNPGIPRAVDKRMAESATDLLIPGMDPMAEIDRLLGSNGS
jgi:hypothetical protein